MTTYVALTDGQSSILGNAFPDAVRRIGAGHGMSFDQIAWEEGEHAVDVTLAETITLDRQAPELRDYAYEIFEIEGKTPEEVQAVLGSELELTIGRW